MGLLQKILFLVVVLGVFQQAISQTNVTISVSPSISITVSPSISNTVSPSISNTVSPSISNTVSPSISNTVSTSISNTVSTSISNTLSTSISTSTSVSLTVTYQFGLPQITGVSDACPTDPSRACVYFDTPNPTYPTYNIYLTRNGTSLKFVTSTVPTAASPFIISAANAPGFTPGNTYFIQVAGQTAQGVQGQISVPLVINNDFPAIDSQPFDTTRVHNVRCGLVGNIFECRYDVGTTYTYKETHLILRCSGNSPNTNKFQLANTVTTFTSTDTFLATPVPYGSTCTSKLKSSYNGGGKNTKFVLRNILTPAQM